MSSCLALLLAGAASSAAASEPLHEPFRVMTYNVRQVNAADTGAYTWENRSPGVIAVIADNDPDIFGVQESSSKVIQDDLVAAFDAAYDRFQPTNGSPKTIFFRRGRFERLVMPPEDGQGNISIPNPYPEDHACFDNANGRTAAWVKLRDLVSGRGYLIVNAHVAHGSACYQARNLAADALHALIAAQSDGLGVVLFGDLNSDPQTAGASGDDDIVELLEAPQPGYRLARSARHSGDTSADTATFNSAWKAHSNNYSRLDYIFTKIADATTYHQSVDRREVDGITPSDHFAVLATIRTAPFGPDPLIDDRGDAPGPRSPSPTSPATAPPTSSCGSPATRCCASIPATAPASSALLSSAPPSTPGYGSPTSTVTAAPIASNGTRAAAPCESAAPCATAASPPLRTAVTSSKAAAPGCTSRGSTPTPAPTAWRGTLAPSTGGPGSPCRAATAASTPSSSTTTPAPARTPTRGWTSGT
ncbi:endonuclease/exonuclease/phosphatase family protein [Nannocystis pusilla]|uniref:endonuclease/exonuclease/phosphatase family protein n=1 Tax=Nannocystis pusilla TaxID=889268 RepID=UPI003B7F1AD9